MTPRRRRFPASRSAVTSALALAVSLVACERQLPTSADIAAMDAAAVESVLEQLNLITPASGVIVYYLDGVQVSGDVARGVPAGQITGTAVLRAPPGTIQMELRTQEGAPVRAGPIRADTLPDLGAAGGGSDLAASRGGERAAGRTTSGFHGLIFLDGEPVSVSALRGLRREQIQVFEIIKSEAAIRMYDDPRAAHGVIRITTREGTALR